MNCRGYRCRGRGISIPIGSIKSQIQRVEGLRSDLFQFQ